MSQMANTQSCGSMRACKGYLVKSWLQVSQRHLKLLVNPRKVPPGESLSPPTLIHKTNQWAPVWHELASLPRATTHGNDAFSSLQRIAAMTAPE